MSSLKWGQVIKSKMFYFDKVERKNMFVVDEHWVSGLKSKELIKTPDWVCPLDSKALLNKCPEHQNVIEWVAWTTNHYWAVDNC